MGSQATGAVSSAIESPRPMTRFTPRVLAADDQPDILESLDLLLKPEGFELETAASPQGVLAAVEQREFDVLLIDLNYTRDTTSGREGMDLLAKLQALDATLPVVVMTAWGSVPLVVEAMRRGARDFVQKPWDNERLVSILRTQVELARALRRGQRLEAENLALRDVGRPLLIAESAAMRPVLELIERVGPSDANVLITGENGTGKGSVAAALHAVSTRAGKPLVTVNAGGLSEGVFESELFGHVKGAFTDAKADRVGRFELADGGTLFLDEIANVPLNLQPKLLRVLETGEFERVGSSRTRRVDVRILSATNADLRQEVTTAASGRTCCSGSTRSRSRCRRCATGARTSRCSRPHFLRQHAQRYRKPITRFHAEATRALTAHGWPGNVRELDHAVERAVLMARADEIREADLGLKGGSSEAPRQLDDMSLEEVEAFLIKKALQRHGGNVSRAAEALGLSRSALYRRLQRYEL